MPRAAVNGITINYEVLGRHGPWVALSPGGRRAIEGVQSLAKRMAAAGYRALVHDRHNCGASDVVIEGEESENEIWADDLHELLKGKMTPCTTRRWRSWSPASAGSSPN